MRLVKKYTFPVLLLFSCSGALAADITTSFTVTASVQPTCTLSTVSPLAFGIYNPLAAGNTDANTSIGVTCTVETSYDIKLNAGTTADATIAQRKMQGAEPENTLGYNLYRDATRTAVWGSTTGADTVSGIGTGLTISHTVYGRIAAGATANVDDYSDTITVTVTY